MADFCTVNRILEIIYNVEKLQIFLGYISYIKQVSNTDSGFKKDFQKVKISYYFTCA